LAQTTSPRLATASKDGTVRIWNTATRRLDFVLTGHAASVNVVRWGGEGVIYTGSSDRTVKVWSAADVSDILQAISREADRIGKTDTYIIGARPLGQHHGPQYRLCATYRSIRSHWQKAQG
jgi:WD40 repeat protein